MTTKTTKSSYLRTGESQLSLNSATLIAPESWAMAAICLLDLATTLFWVSYRDASEGNPLMAFYLEHGGTPAFIAAKIVLCALPLLVAEWARRSRPQFVHGALRCGIVAYMALYAVGVAHVNAAEAAQTQAETTRTAAAR